MKYTTYRSLFVLLILAFPFILVGGDAMFTPTDLLNTRTCDEAVISPDGEWIAYTVRRTRDAGDKPGSAYEELFLVSTRSRRIKPFITGDVSVGTLRWRPDGQQLAFLTKRGPNTTNAKKQVWIISIHGGEAVQATHSKTGVLDFQWHPRLNKIAYLATTPPSDHETILKDRGYGFIFFEENLKHRNLYMVDVNPSAPAPARQLTQNITLWDFVFSPDGKTIAATVSPKNLVDHRYMFRRIHLLDTATLKMHRLTQNQGKLGRYQFSPDGSKLVYTGALDRKDHSVSQLLVVDIQSKKETNLTPSNFRGHIQWARWKDNKTLAFYAGEGVWPTLSLIPATGGKRRVILHSRDTGTVFRGATFTTDFKYAAFAAESPHKPYELFYWSVGKGNPVPLTDHNPWLKDRKLAKQEVVRFKNREGLEIEGILIYPTDYRDGQRYPLVVTVHGGPESHYSNGWLTSYSRPAQVLAARGYAVFYPNYRASTGYGVEFAMVGYEDAAGKEFDDLADGIDFLVEKGIADRDRVGLGGGSYGGYAAAWFATYYTKYVRAVCMFIGISDLISKRGTTDIPYEELYVHSGKPLEEMWQESLKRSPIYWAHQSKTAVLITGGAEDKRVHPSQSLEFYRRLKMNQHPAVRLVQYPGEPHGNYMQTSQIDLMYRILQWYDWYVKDKNSLDDPMPPLDISANYGLDGLEN